MKSRLTFASVAIAAVIVSASLHAAEIHVSTRGQDGNPGTKAKPVATLQGAQKVVRQHIAKGLQEPVSVIIDGGTYYLDAPLALAPEDSGTAKCPITWRAAEGETILLSGGVRIPGNWKKGADGIWSVAVPDVKEGWNFRQLFVDGKRAIRVRFTNADEANPFLYATGGGADHAIIDPKLLKASWGTAPDAQINVVAQWKFFNQWNTVTGVDPAKGRINIADSERHGKITRGNWFWIEGVKKELDQHGEWYLDRAEGRLYYMPEPGVDPNTLAIVAPRLNVIVDAKGEVEKKTHVEYVTFSGLEFRHSTLTLGHIEARVHTDAAIRLKNANHCRIENCHVENVGGYAFWLHLDSQRNVIDRNTVLNSGGGGVHLDSRPASMAMAPGNYIAHNYFADLSRNVIFAFRNQGGNIVEYNHIHDAMQTTVDGACIHFGTMNHLNAPNYILNNWLYDIWGYEQKPDGKPKRHLANGVFLDWDSSNMTVKDNYVYNAGGAPIKVIWQNCCGGQLEYEEGQRTRLCG